jgi:hypothetical protein
MKVGYLNPKKQSHINRHEGLEKRIMEGYIPGRRSEVSDQKGDGFRILQMNSNECSRCGISCL